MQTAVIDRTTKQPVAESQIPKVLGSAASMHAPVLVQRSTESVGAGSAGRVLASGATTVRVLLDDADAADRLAVADLSVTMTVGGVRYVFASKCASASAGGTGTLEIATPRELFVLERRRTVRRRLQQGLNVRLAPCHDDSTDADVMTAAILNVSQRGLACRLHDSETTRLSVADKLSVSFSLHRGIQTFVFIGRIVSITQGGTPGQMVLGIEFIDGETSDAHEALGAALTTDTDV